MTSETPTPSASAEIREAVPSREAREAAIKKLTRPIVGIANRTAQEAFDIMADRIRSHFEATIRSEPASAARGVEVTPADRNAAAVIIAATGGKCWSDPGAREAVAIAYAQGRSTHPSPPVQVGQEREAVAQIVESARGHLANIRAHGNAEANACIAIEEALALLPTDARAAAVEQPASEVVREALEAARDGLLREAVHMEQDYPGDVPVDCGWWCRLCKDHVAGDRKIGPSAQGHQPTCPIAKIGAALAATPPASSDAAVSETGSGEREAIRREIINTPETADFMAAIPIEAVHQRERWGVEHDAGKSPFDWFWLIGYLAQKAAEAATRGDADKAMHHTISTAAALANWHVALTGVDTRMRPGIGPDNGGEKPGSAHDLAAALHPTPSAAPLDRRDGEMGAVSNGERLEAICKAMEYAVGGGMAWIDQSECTDFVGRIRSVAAACDISADSNFQMRAILQDVCQWLNDIPPIGTPGTLVMMRKIHDVLQLSEPVSPRLREATDHLLASTKELLGPLEQASAEMVAHGHALNEEGEAAFDRARQAIAAAEAALSSSSASKETR